MINALCSIKQKVLIALRLLFVSRSFFLSPKATKMWNQIRNWEKEELYLKFLMLRHLLDNTGYIQHPCPHFLLLTCVQKFKNDISCTNAQLHSGYDIVLPVKWRQPEGGQSPAAVQTSRQSEGRKRAFLLAGLTFQSQGVSYGAATVAVAPEALPGCQHCSHCGTTQVQVALLLQPFQELCRYLFSMNPVILMTKHLLNSSGVLYLISLTAVGAGHIG